MTPKSFFLILIKIMGIFLLYHILISGVNTYNYTFFYMGYMGESATFVDKLVFLLSYAIFIAVIILFFIIKPNSLIKIFRLDKDFDEEKFEFNIEKTSILKISIIVIGGIMFVKNLPYFISEVIKYFQLRVINIGENNNIGWTIYYTITVIIGFLLMTNSKKIVDFITKKENPNEIN